MKKTFKSIEKTEHPLDRYSLNEEHSCGLIFNAINEITK
jgi:hypothetical protein